MLKAYVSPCGCIRSKGNLCKFHIEYYKVKEYIETISSEVNFGYMTIEEGLEKLKFTAKVIE